MTIRSGSSSYRALDALMDGPAPASDIGANVWPTRRRGKGFSSGGGGDYAAQMLLGRLKKAGLVEHAPSDGSSLWRLTQRGREAYSYAK